MARINLLPWREQLREERKKQFISILVLIVLFAGLLVFLGDRNLNGKIDQQNARNDFLRKEISLLDGRIKEIEQLQARRTQLLDRMKIIQDLQGNRPIIVRVFDEMARTLPDGVYFTSVNMKGAVIGIKGGAESNSRVSNLMRQMDASDWLTTPNLTAVKAVTQGALDQANVFEMSVRQTEPGAPAAEGEQQQ
ncbi:pilus assembly protein PilN [Pseudomonas sp. G11-1]|uniref:Type IV pilus assembly protein PilN n=1 Tax=Halopseudomonas bauzanensis TaxID=653930 RepID=A0A1H9NMS0_9GAMM|nr:MULTISPECIES: PilN domain-containing protein [Halopseudomonas]MCO5785723.1 pilus assembly protein PilN [Pseudomonas sp. G11-1]MCO5788173.1 pilus assembly protein PilN [Pseudomonas sp. G11-2]WGK61299.1 PilN domain-containing protein [Halopseudomonas sp. SMJS2]SER37260.1 type IV pilus assembly protein PilN [Halopseudomonas bauzanensis]SFL79822.1 type IV pilus assembly protein PilN [Halopseudomonas bauzanensis]